MKRFGHGRVFITGSGSGLGRAMARHFSRMGWRVAVSDIDADRAGATHREIADSGGESIAIPCDATDENQLARAADTILSRWGGVDILVNNAGIAAGGYMEKIPPAEWGRIMSVNFMSVVLGCRVFIPVLKRQGAGHIVNIASSAGIVSLPEMASYNASKAAVISLSETLRAELAPHSIGVTVACPTFIRTNLMESFVSTDESQRRSAERFFARSRFTPELFAAHTFNAVRKNRLYAFAQNDGRLAWRCKRFFPEFFYRIIARRYGRIASCRTEDISPF